GGDPLSKGTGTMTRQYPWEPSPSSTKTGWTGTCWFIEGIATGQNFTLSITNDTYNVGSTCWSPTKITRVYTRTSTGATAGATTVSHPGANPCDAPPAVSSFSPASGLTGSVATINGTGFTNATAVSFNGKAATSFTVVSDTQIKATVPNGASTGKIAVTSTNGTGSSATNYTVTLSITSFSPTSGPKNTVVT